MLQFLDLIAVIFLRGITLVAYVLPTAWIINAGRFVGGAAYYLFSSRSRIAHANLRAAFYRSKTPGELKNMVKSVYKSIVGTFAETMCIPKIDKKYIDKYIKIENLDIVKNALKKRKGAIFLTGHFGNWELTAIVSGIIDIPLFILARSQKMKRVNAFINNIRESKGSVVVQKGITTRYILKALHDGKVVAMVADQSGGPNGIVTNLFGRPVPTAYGAYRFAAKTGAIVIPVFSVREKGPYHRIFVEEPIEITDKKEMKPYVQKYNDLLESYATRFYDQWLWFHRRWKCSPLKRIVILSDGKKGHLNQSLSLAKIFQKFRADKNIAQELAPIEVVEIRFKNSFWKNFINVCSKYSAPSACQGCLACLKFGLEVSSYKKLIRIHADVVISTGFSLAGVNSIFTFENNAKNAVCMKPGLLSHKKFNMIVLPRHDMKRRISSKKVIYADVVPNLVDGSYLESGRKSLSKHLKNRGALTVGVLMGGDNAGVTYDEDCLSKIFLQVLDASRKLRADVLVTTSRRTAKNVETLAKKKFGNDALCKILVIANENNLPYAVSGILGLSDVLVVSGESISMVSEAVSSGKRTIVFKGRPLKNKKSKYDNFLGRLQEKGYLKIAGEDDMADALCEAMAEDPVPVDTGESSLIYKNMWRLGG